MLISQPRWASIVLRNARSSLLRRCSCCLFFFCLYRFRQPPNFSPSYRGDTHARFVRATRGAPSLDPIARCGMRLRVSSYQGPANVIKRAALIVGLLYVGALLVPGFFLHHAADQDSFVVSADYHYGLVFGSALRAAEGEVPSALRVNFGLLSTVTAGWLARLFRIETFSGWIRLTQSFQVLFLVCAVAGAWALRRDGRIVLVVLFAIGPFVSTVNPLVLNPNISGFRFLCLALLPIVLAVLKQRAALSGALVGGGAAALFTLWNTETGVACSAAIFFYLFVNEITAGKTPLATIPVVAAAGLIQLLLVVAVFIGIAGTEGLPRFFAHLSGHAHAGYNGHPFDQWSLVALAFAFYASTLAIYCRLKKGEGSGDRDLVARAALAVSAVVWFAYYAHNAFYYVLWIYLFLLLLTVGPTLAAKRGATIVAALVVVACNVAVLRRHPRPFHGSKHDNSGPGLAAGRSIVSATARGSAQIGSRARRFLFR